MKAQMFLIFLASMPAVAKVTPLSEISVIEVIAPLIIVIILIFVLAWIVKKINPIQRLGGKDIIIISSTPILSNARLCLVRVGSKDILVGVTSQQITHIQTFSEPVVELLSDHEEVMHPKNAGDC